MCTQIKSRKTFFTRSLNVSARMVFRKHAFVCNNLFLYITAATVLLYLLYFFLTTLPYRWKLYRVEIFYPFMVQLNCGFNPLFMYKFLNEQRENVYSLRNFSYFVLPLKVRYNLLGTHVYVYRCVSSLF